VSSLFAVPPWAEVWRRMPRLMAGLVLCGVTFACIVRSHLGLDPWDVLHQGISNHTGIPIGRVSVLVALVVLLGWIPLRQKVGLGTICNAVVIGLTMDQVLSRLPEADDLRTRWILLVVGLLIAGPSISLYIGARLGPGPRDGIMTGIAERGPSIRLARTGIELTALLAGFLLGGNVGIGTVLFALTVGPNVQFWLGRLDMGYPPGFEPAAPAPHHHEAGPHDPPDVEPDFTVAGS